MNHIEALKIVRSALKELSCLGNGNFRGNSVGNDIASAAYDATDTIEQLTVASIAGPKFKDHLRAVMHDQNRTGFPIMRLAEFIDAHCAQQVAAGIIAHEFDDAYINAWQASRLRDQAAEIERLNCVVDAAAQAQIVLMDEQITELDQLILAIGNAYFDAGEWDNDQFACLDEHETLELKCSNAKRAMREFFFRAILTHQTSPQIAKSIALTDEQIESLVPWVGNPADPYFDRIAFARSILAQSAAQGADDARDAARYRWLRDESNNMSDVVPWHMPTATFLTGDVLDILIDAAIAALVQGDL